MEITRRNFLTGAAAMGGLAAFGLAGCAPKGAQADTGEALAETGREASATATEGGEVTPEPTPDITIDVDVVVIGGGASGLCAAISAAQNGAKVILFEKQAQLGGNGMMPEGLFAVNSPKQAELGIESPRKIDIIANEFQFNNFRITYDYWSNYIDGSGESVAWLLDLGVVIERVESMFGSPEVFHYGEGGHCEQMIETLIAATDTLGIDVHLNTPAIRLKQEDGAVVGAYAESPEGIILANAKAVILTSGGFSGDTEKVRELVGYDTTYMQTPPNPANVGDGMRMAFEMGGCLSAGGLPHGQPIRRRCARHRSLRHFRWPAVLVAQRAWSSLRLGGSWNPEHDARCARQHGPKESLQHFRRRGVRATLQRGRPSEAVPYPGPYAADELGR